MATTKPQIAHEGTKIVLPADPKPMDLKTAIDWLRRIQADEETVITITETIDAFPMDGAHALALAIEELYGFAQERPWGNQTVSIPSGPGQTVQVPWGSFRLPGIDGTIETEMARNERGQQVFAIEAVVQKKYKPAIKTLAETVRRLVKEHSLYRGKALEWRDESTAPAFLDLSGVRLLDLQLPDDIMEQFETTVLTPLRERDACLEAGIPFKRGTALVGPYGTGKTMAVHVAAQTAVSHGIMFLMVRDPEQFERAMRFARQYGPAVVAVEDIDQATAERNRVCDAIMEALDGLESKDQAVMVLFTSNHVDKIHEAMRRPGRIDTFIEIGLPDVPTIVRLLYQYSAGLYDGTDASLVPVAELLLGHIPAEIREVAEVAKLSAVRLRGQVEYVTADDLTVAAKYVLQRDRLFTVPKNDDAALEQMARFGTQLVQGIVSAVGWKDLDAGMQARSDITARVTGENSNAYRVQH